jgi:Xaa-Pro dipeptidase|tara:strand:- start:67 stop:1179 length:1113 start_codon:yes stop_codon:yes gene_type:complete
MSEVITARVKKVFSFTNFMKVKPDAILIKNGIEGQLDSTFFYLSGIRSGLFEGCSVIAYPTGKLCVFTSKLEEQSALKTPNIEVITFENGIQYKKLLQKKLKNVRVLGMNLNELSYTNYLWIRMILKNIKRVDVSKAIAKARCIKDEKEIKTLRKSAKIASNVLPIILDSLDNGITENQLSSIINYNLEKQGASSPSFQTIVAFGKHSAEPHYAPQNYKLKRNNLVLCDYGAKYDRYCSDITRTVFFGKINKEIKEIYETVQQASEIGLSKIRSGVKANVVHNAVEDFINSTKYKGRFIHSTGHSIGLNVHDGASISKKSEIILEEGMAFTIEPGIYLPKIGGVRIEDDVIVKKGKPEIITKVSRELIEI